MSEYEITTHMKCTATDYPTVLKQYRALLGNLGFDAPSLDDWFSHAVWDAEGFGYLSQPLWEGKERLFDPQVLIRAHILGYADVTATQGDYLWIQLSIVFEDNADTIELAVSDTGGSSQYRYRQRTGAVVWRWALSYMQYFPRTAIFFNDAATVNEPWNAMLGVPGNRLSAFDLALLPTDIAIHLPALPSHVEVIDLPGHRGFAPRDRWQALPWFAHE